jgi:prepilin-type N-terminal cleavage/methylation domain-containing protein/prepilin-type processing-associated H-X9-DG protein
MQTRENHRSQGFTLIELLTVITVIGILAAMLMPALSSAREKGKQIACSSNLHQIGIALLSYASDYQNHTPPAYQLINNATVTWYTALTNGNYATPKVFQCPDDRRLASPGNTPRSYAMVVGYDNGSKYSQNYWIAGSRVTCPWLTNSQVAVVAEYYSDNIQPTIEDNGTISPFVTSSYDTYSPPNGIPPSSKHVNDSTHLKGNYLFLDGHVEFVNGLRAPGGSPGSDPLADKMFPAVPGTPNGAPSPFVPCP